MNNSIMDYAATLKDVREKNILIMRLNGDTLEEIAQFFNLTRERIRQILWRTLRKIRHLNFEEDKYRYLFENYYISKSLFMKIFNESEITYNYLKHREYQKNEKSPLGKVFYDDNVSDEIKDQIRKTTAIEQNYVLIDGEEISRQKIQILTYFMKDKPTMKYQDLFEKYNLFVHEHKLDDFAIPSILRLQNMCLLSPYILILGKSTAKYYNINARSYERMFHELNLIQYDNMEISAQLLFKKHNELLSCPYYDIHNAYEFHSLIRKLHVMYNLSNSYANVPQKITFLRNPMIKFGEGNRLKQLQDMAANFNTLAELACAYEEKYGMSAKSLKTQLRLQKGENEHMAKTLPILWRKS